MQYSGKNMRLIDYIVHRYESMIGLYDTFQRGKQ